MPYIDKARRTYLLNAGLRELAKEIQSPGEFNFVISFIFLYLFKQRQSYAAANSLMGAIECAKIEIYRRFVAPYEDTKITINGDISLSE